MTKAMCKSTRRVNADSSLFKKVPSEFGLALIILSNLEINLFTTISLVIILFIYSIRNISERVHSGRKSQEAARFRAVIEAIRAAGNAGVKKLQINTDYINM